MGEYVTAHLKGRLKFYSYKFKYIYYVYICFGLNVKIVHAYSFHYK